MQVFKNLFTSRPTTVDSSKDGGRTTATATTTTADHTLQDQFEAQTVRLQEIHKAQRPKNTARTYEPKQKEWEDWCARCEVIRTVAE
jgi:hypothetical protein